MARKPTPDSPDLVAARKDVLSRMSGCPDAGCFACKANRQAIEDLIAIVRNERDD